MATYENQIDATANYIGAIGMIVEGIALDYKHEWLHRFGAAIRELYGYAFSTDEISEDFGQWSDNIEAEFKDILGINKYQFYLMCIKKLVELIEKQQRQNVYKQKFISKKMLKSLKSYEKPVNGDKYKQFTHLLIKHAKL